MKDLTVLYYTCNRIPPLFGFNIRRSLENLCMENDVPIISISHQAMLFGYNIWVGDYEVSIYNIYRQILLGAKEAKTEYVMCAEDDALYNLEHFSKRPEGNKFIYNMNRWYCDHDIFFHRNRMNMSMCIAPTRLMIDTLEKRFEKYPRIMPREELVGFGEPGRSEFKLGLPPVDWEIFNTDQPTIVFNHRPSVGGVRKILPNDKILHELPHWGKAIDLWQSTYGDGGIENDRMNDGKISPP